MRGADVPKADVEKQIDERALAQEEPKPAKVDPKKPDAKPEAKADAKPEAKADVKPEPKARFTLQLSSFQDRTEADAYLQQLKSNGQPSAYVTEADVDGKTFYRVRLGNYRSLDAANDAKADFEKGSKKTVSVMKL